MSFESAAAAEAGVVDPSGSGGSARRRSEIIPIKTKILFACGDTIDGFSTTAIATFHLFYLTAVCGLSGSLAGISVFFALWVDAFIDPLIGSVSDNWRSRYGRRHPFLFVSILPMALGLGLAFSVPHSLSGTSLFIYATAVSLTLRISYSVFTLPFLAMGAELSSDYVERSRLIVYRVFFNTVANLLCTYFGFRVFMSGSQGLLDRDAYTPFGWTCAALLVMGGLLCAFGTINQRHRLHAPSTVGGSVGLRFFSEIAEIFRSRSFVILFATVLLFWTAQGTAGVLALHANKFFWKLPNDIIQYVAVSIAIGGLAGIPVAGVIARFVEKRTVVATTLIVNCAQQGILPLLRIGNLLPPNGTALYSVLVMLAFLLGLSGAVSGIYFQSMMADATDEHELLFGSRREGLYFAGITLSAKAAIAIGSLIGGFALDAIGFPRDLSRNFAAALHLDPTSVLQLGVVSGPLPAAISMASLVLLLAYRIDRATQQRIATILIARRANDGGPR